MRHNRTAVCFAGAFVAPTSDSFCSVFVRDAIFDLNVRGTFITCQEAIRWMVSHGGGSIVNISSTASEKAYSPAASYGPSKAAVNNMSCVDEPMPRILKKPFSSPQRVRQDGI